MKRKKMEKEIRRLQRIANMRVRIIPAYDDEEPGAIMDCTVEMVFYMLNYGYEDKIWKQEFNGFHGELEFRSIL